MTPSRVQVPTILIVAYRSDAYLEDCLTCLGPRSSVIVVDNDASEKTRRVVASAGARYLAAPSNIGFAAAVNLGLRASWNGVSDVLLLNPDARISGADVIRLQHALHRGGGRHAAVSPLLVDPAGTAQRAEWPLPSPAQAWLEALGLSMLWRGPQFVIGAVLMLDGTALAQVGWFDERYFLYAEEADWQLRALRAGWSVGLARDITAVHVGGASSGDQELRERIFHASREIFGRRWYGTQGWSLMRLASVLAAARRCVVGTSTARLLNRRILRLYIRGPLRTAPPDIQSRCV